MPNSRKGIFSTDQGGQAQVAIQNPPSTSTLPSTNTETVALLPAVIHLSPSVFSWVLVFSVHIHLYCTQPNFKYFKQWCLEWNKIRLLMSRTASRTCTYLPRRKWHTIKWKKGKRKTRDFLAGFVTSVAFLFIKLFAVGIISIFHQIKLFVSIKSLLQALCTVLYSAIMQYQRILSYLYRACPCGNTKGKQNCINETALGGLNCNCWIYFGNKLQIIESNPLAF